MRLPELTDLSCPSSSELACKLSGSGLFLLDSISDGSQFDHPVQVPDGFPGYVLPVPHPTDGRLYIKLRDDPSAINTATLVSRQLSGPGEGATGALAGKHASSDVPDPPVTPLAKSTSDASVPTNNTSSQDASTPVANTPTAAAGRMPNILATPKPAPPARPN